ncbi:hypothetical protein V6N12_066317 [Hibiscus sabdariffa]|uniref:Uncharacterized protein n=1 Tax=Hibiscus sabdariffa TaxID=183260 RepID=A0ABR2CPS5_9ROSI
MAVFITIAAPLRCMDYGGRSNQHNMANEGEGSNASSNFILVAYYAIPKELPHNDGLYTVLSLELLAVPEATNNSNWIQNQYITNKEQDDNEGFSLPCIGSMMASSKTMEKSRKRTPNMMN